MQNIKKTHGVDHEKKCVTDEQTDGQANRTDFIEPPSQRWRFDHVFQKFENKISLNYFV